GRRSAGHILRNLCGSLIEAVACSGHTVNAGGAAAGFHSFDLLLVTDVICGSRSSEGGAVALNRSEDRVDLGRLRLGDRDRIGDGTAGEGGCCYGRGAGEQGAARRGVLGM